MSQTLPIAAHAEPNGAHRSGGNPGSVPDSALFALLMADAGWPFSGGLPAGANIGVDADGEVAANSTFGDSAGGVVPEAAFDSDRAGEFLRSLRPGAEANAGGISTPERFRPALNLDATRDDASRTATFRRAVSGMTAAVLDETHRAGDVPVNLEAEKGVERGARLTTEVGVADPEADAGAARADRARIASSPPNPPADLPSTPRPVRLTELDLEGFGVKRIEVQLEHVNGHPSGETPLTRDSIDRATLRSVDGAIPMEAFRSRLDHSRTSEGGMRVSVEVEEAALADHVDSGAGESSGGRAASDLEWNAIVTGRSTRPGKSEPEVPVETGVDVPDIQPDAARPTGELRTESRESSAVVGERRALAPQPPTPLDRPTLTPEPARRVLMMVGDAGNEVHVLVHESNGDVSVRFDAPHAIRAHLEASAQQLIESMSREQVSLMSMTFSGPSHGNDGRSNPRHMNRTGGPKAAAPGSSDDTPTMESLLEFAGNGSRVCIRV